MRFTYTTVNFNSAGETSLQIVRQTGIFEKKYKSTTVKYNMQYFDSISLFKDDIANQVADILNSKEILVGKSTIFIN